MVFRHGGMKGKSEMGIQQLWIENRGWINYLGLLLNYIGKFTKTQQQLVDQERKALLKLYCHHINGRHIYFYIKSISVHPLLWMNVMLDFICMIFAELWSTESKSKIQNYDVCLRRDSNQRQTFTQSNECTGILDLIFKKYGGGLYNDRSALSISGKLNNFFFNIETKCSIFYTYVNSILSYASEVWGFHKGSDIEKVHLMFCKRMLGFEKNVSIKLIYFELGRLPCHIFRKMRVKKYWLKLRNMTTVYLKLVMKKW